MKYMSDDGKLFKTEEECLRYENLNKIREGKIKIIRNKYEDFIIQIMKFREEYNINSPIYFSLVSEIVDMLRG